MSKKLALACVAAVGCAASPAAPAPPPPPPVSVLESFEALLDGQGGELYTVHEGSCGSWKVSPGDDADEWHLEHTTSDGRIVGRSFSYDRADRSMGLYGIGTSYDPAWRADENGWATIGSASLCVWHVKVTARGDAILFGDMPWYLSMASCERSTRLARSSGCGE